MFKSLLCAVLGSAAALLLVPVVIEHSEPAGVQRLHAAESGDTQALNVFVR